MQRQGESRSLNGWRGVGSSRSFSSLVFKSLAVRSIYGVDSVLSW